jgi:hypothetical protein
VLEAIGPIALSVTSDIKDFISEIMIQVKESLAQRGYVSQVLLEDGTILIISL